MLISHALCKTHPRHPLDLHELPTLHRYAKCLQNRAPQRVSVSDTSRRISAYYTANRPDRLTEACSTSRPAGAAQTPTPHLAEYQLAGPVRQTDRPTDPADPCIVSGVGRTRGDLMRGRPAHRPSARRPPLTSSHGGGRRSARASDFASKTGSGRAEGRAPRTGGGRCEQFRSVPNTLIGLEWPTSARPRGQS